MHKFEDIYLKTDFDAENELNLFEPECIITDNPLNIKEINYSILEQEEDDFDRTELHEDQFHDQNIWNVSFNSYNIGSKDCSNSIIVNNGFVPSQDPFNISNTSQPSPSSEQLVDMDHMQMHSIFAPEKRNKPKEVFTKCQNCEKFVIIRMCPETGDYSKCKFCYNIPFSCETTATSIALEVSESISISKPIIKPRKEPPPVPCKNDASFKCDFCGKLFTRNWYLKQHIKLHSNEKPFSCNHCDKRFLNSSNLKQHLKTHSVEYRCCLCDKTYINIESLRLHAEKHTSDSTKQQNGSVSNESPCKLLTCNYCNDRFTSFEDLKEHAVSHTKDMPFQCDKCDKGFRYNGALIKHKKIHDSGFLSKEKNTKNEQETVQQ